MQAMQVLLRLPLLTRFCQVFGNVFCCFHCKKHLYIYTVADLGLLKIKKLLQVILNAKYFHSTIELKSSWHKIFLFRKSTFNCIVLHLKTEICNKFCLVIGIKMSLIFFHAQYRLNIILYLIEFFFGNGRS